jgi:hypothetical protein
MGSKPADEELEAAQTAIESATPLTISPAEAEASAPTASGPSASLRGGSTYLTQFEARLLVAIGFQPCLQPALRNWRRCSAPMFVLVHCAGGRAIQGWLAGVSVLAALDVVRARGARAPRRVLSVGLLRLVRQSPRWLHRRIASYRAGACGMDISLP